MKSIGVELNPKGYGIIGVIRANAVNTRLGAEWLIVKDYGICETGNPSNTTCTRAHQKRMGAELPK